MSNYSGKTTKVFALHGKLAGRVRQIIAPLVVRWEGEKNYNTKTTKTLFNTWENTKNQHGE